MKRLGNRVHAERGFNVYEVVDSSPDDPGRSPLGFAIAGNGLEPLVLYRTLEDAIDAIHVMHRGCTPTPGFAKT